MSTDDSTIFNTILDEIAETLKGSENQTRADLVHRMSRAYIDWLREQPSESRPVDETFDELAAIVVTLLYIVGRGVENGSGDPAPEAVINHRFLTTLHEHLLYGAEEEWQEQRQEVVARTERVKTMMNALFPDSTETDEASEKDEAPDEAPVASVEAPVSPLEVHTAVAVLGLPPTEEFDAAQVATALADTEITFSSASVSEGMLEDTLAVPVTLEPQPIAEDIIHQTLSAIETEMVNAVSVIVGPSTDDVVEPAPEVDLVNSASTTGGSSEPEKA